MYKRAGQAPTHTEIALNTFRHSNSNALGFFVIHVVFFFVFWEGVSLSFSFRFLLFSSDDDSVRGAFFIRCSAFLPSITFTLCTIYVIVFQSVRGVSSQHDFRAMAGEHLPQTGLRIMYIFHIFPRWFFFCVLLPKKRTNYQYTRTHSRTHTQRAGHAPHTHNTFVHMYTAQWRNSSQSVDNSRF